MEPYEQVFKAELRALRAELGSGIEAIVARLDEHRSDLTEVKAQIREIKSEVDTSLKGLEERVRGLELAHAEGRGRAAAIVGVSSATVAGVVSALLRVFGVS